MLTMLYGTSCCGKSTLIKILCDQHNFCPINGYMTRTLRNDDFARIPVSVERFREMQFKGEFAIINEHLAGSYGNLRKELELATTETTNYILDFLIKDQYKLDSYPHERIIILPEGKSQLIAQIKQAGRESRMDDILQDYDDHYNARSLKEFIAKGYHLVINVPNKPEIAIHKILTILTKR